MEAPRLGVESELQLKPIPQPQQHWIRASSVTHTAACSNAGSLTPWASQGWNLHPHRDNVRFLTHWATRGAPVFVFLTSAQVLRMPPGPHFENPWVKRMLSVPESVVQQTQIIRGASEWDGEAGNCRWHPQEAHLGAGKMLPALRAM